MWKALTKNFWIKLFCLLAASSLWIYVAAGQNSVGKFPGNIQIRAINVPAGLEAIYDDKAVEIKIMADSSVWKKLSADSFSAYVDLSAYSEGTYELPVNVVSSVTGVQIVEKTPDKIFVSLEKIITKDININKKVEGKAAEGMVAGNIDLSPVKVQARGPKSLVENLAEATVVVKLNGESEDFKKVLSLMALDEKGEQIKNIEFLPLEVAANISIVKASNNKTVGVKVKTDGVPKTGYYISGVSANPATVDVTGPKTLLDDINFIETGSIDVTNASGDIEKEVVLNPKNGIAIQTSSPNRVKVKIKVAQSEITKEMVANIIPKNLAGYSITSYSPSSIKVVVSGPSELINSLNSSDIGLTLDFTGKQIANSMTFDLSQVNFTAPAGISIVSFLPSSLNLTLDRK